MNNGRFKPTPPGEKTLRMREVEEKLGHTLEEDYKEYYLDKGWGQKRLADRWGVKRGLIFGGNLAPGRRSWVKMLGLSVRNRDVRTEQPHGCGLKNTRCALCGIDHITLDSAHWIPREENGPSIWWNLLHLCPNCHRKLDEGDAQTTRAARTWLVSHTAEKFVMKNPKMTPEEFEGIMVRLVNRI